MHDLDTDSMADLIGRKHDCLSQLHDLARRQLSLIDGEQMIDLLNLLAHKQRLIGVLQALDRQLAPFGGQRPEDRHWRSPAARAECGRLLAECETLLGGILEHERRGETELIARREETAIRVQSAYAGHQAHQAYSADCSVAGQELDLSTEG
ncbi:MAG: hypothetical protein AB7O62_19000 [Pirellulales bacterium]